MLLGSMPVIDAAIALVSAKQRSALVVDAAQQLMGLVTLQDTNRALIRSDPDSPTSLLTQELADICTREILYAYPDEAIADALD